MKTIRVIAVMVLIAAAFAGGYVYKAAKADRAGSGGKNARKVLYWVDPMHPAYKSDKPGIAPDCGMKLEPVYSDADSSSTAPAGAERKVWYYRDPKDSNYTSQQPGVNPETGSQLQPVYADDPSTMQVGTVQITPEKQQLVGVKYGKVERRGGSRTIRAVGKVAFDETRIQHIHTKLEGWIDQVFVDYTGQLVSKGQPLMTIYSPDMFSSQRELLLALRATNTMRDNPLPAAFDQSESLLKAARLRLELWDVSKAQIDQVLKTGQPIKNVTLYSPIAGYVTDRKAFPQLKIMPDTDLYTIVDLSRVWIMADLFEYEAPNIHAGETARVSLEAAPGRTFTARINYIQPQVDPLTRTLKVRLDMDNPGLLLKPDMYADVEFRVNIPVQLTVPAEAVLDAGERKTIFVDRGNGYFEPRQVKIGMRDGARIQILSGLSGDERVVTSGNFLVDSESQLKAAAAGMGGMAGMPGMSPGTSPKAQPGKPDAKSKGMADMPGMGEKK